MGPLNFDVYLLKKALDAPSTNDTQLVDLLVARTPSDLHLLRTAFRHHVAALAAAAATKSKIPTSVANASAGHTSLDTAVLSCYSSSKQVKKAYEVVLQGKWKDVGDVEEGAGAKTEDEKKKLLKEDIDQLKVALRKGGAGNSDMWYVITLAVLVASR